MVPGHEVSWSGVSYNLRISQLCKARIDHDEESPLRFTIVSPQPIPDPHEDPTLQYYQPDKESYTT